MGDGCEFVLDDMGDCGAPGTQAVSVRHPASDVWQSWSVCPEHVQALPADLRGTGLFVVTEPYDAGDLAGRRDAESVETVSVDDYEFRAAFDAGFVPAPDDLGWRTIGLP